jgi:hypothetical protein
MLKLSVNRIILNLSNFIQDFTYLFDLLIKQ